MFIIEIEDGDLEQLMELLVHARRVADDAALSPLATDAERNLFRLKSTSYQRLETATHGAQRVRPTR